MFDQLKPIMRNGERYIVVEGNRPEYVLMRFPDYVALVAGRSANPGHTAPADDVTFANAELESFRRGGMELSAPAAADRPAAPDPATIRLEDLPL